MDDVTYMKKNNPEELRIIEHQWTKYHNIIFEDKDFPLSALIKITLSTSLDGKIKRFWITKALWDKEDWKIIFWKISIEKLAAFSNFLVENLSSLKEWKIALSEIEWKQVEVSKKQMEAFLSSKEWQEILEEISKSETSSETLLLLLKKISGEEKISTLISWLTEEEKDLLSINHIELQKRRVLEELRDRLTHKFSETSWNDSWQRWISQNCWITWANYLQPIEKEKINITGIMPDYLFPTHDGFVDILEIKLPEDEVIKEDSSHAGSWVWTTETNKAIGQVVNYLWEIDRLKLEIERNILEKYKKSISLLKPRAYIIIWNDEKWYKWDNDFEIKRKIKLEALRKLNRTLHWIEIITYAELLRRGQSFIPE